MYGTLALRVQYFYFTWQSCPGRSLALTATTPAIMLTTLARLLFKHANIQTFTECDEYS